VVEETGRFRMVGGGEDVDSSDRLVVDDGAGVDSVYLDRKLVVLVGLGVAISDSSILIGAIVDIDPIEVEALFRFRPDKGGAIILDVCDERGIEEYEFEVDDDVDRERDEGGGKILATEVEALMMVELKAEADGAKFEAGFIILLSFLPLLLIALLLILSQFNRVPSTSTLSFSIIIISSSESDPAGSFRVGTA
jgi:hypothetical protein